MDGTYPAHARQIYYAARGPMLAMTGREKMDSSNFTQKILMNYIRDNPEETADWDVVFDARGSFIEPHTEEEIGLGTVEVREYLEEVERGKAIDIDIDLQRLRRYPTLGPVHRYSAILFIEKEGFGPLLKAAHIPERFDIGIMGSKGQSVTVARKLADVICGEYGIPLLPLRDFDIAEFSISHALKNNTERYTFENEINVIELGLSLKDVQQYGLASEVVSVPKPGTVKGPQLRWRLASRGATDEEVDFLCSGKRVELNAFTSVDFISFLEEKLRANGTVSYRGDPHPSELAFSVRALGCPLLAHER